MKMHVENSKFCINDSFCICICMSIGCMVVHSNAQLVHHVQSTNALRENVRKTRNAPNVPKLIIIFWLPFRFVFIVNSIPVNMCLSKMADSILLAEFCDVKTARTPNANNIALIFVWNRHGVDNFLFSFSFFLFFCKMTVKKKYRACHLVFVCFIFCVRRQW